MVQRLARFGANAGNHFWGCCKYPECKGTLDLTGTPKQEEGDEVEVQAPGGVRRYEIVAVRYE